jgi:hypothetical protein
VFYRVDMHAFHLHSVEKRFRQVIAVSTVGPINYYVAFLVHDDNRQRLTTIIAIPQKYKIK